MLYVYLLGSFDLQYGSGPMFPYWFSVWIIYLSIIEREVLKSPTIIMLLSLSPFRSVSIGLIYVDASMLGENIFNIIISS